MHSCVYPFVVIYNAPNWQAWLTSVWISYTQQQHERGKVASWETAGTLVHYLYHHDDWCRWWDSQPCHPWAPQPFTPRGAADPAMRDHFSCHPVQHHSPCSHTAHPSWAEGGWCVPGTRMNPSHDSNPLLQAPVAGENSAKLTAAFWPCNTGPLHHGQAERETPSYQTSKCQIASSLR